MDWACESKRYHKQNTYYRKTRGLGGAVGEDQPNVRQPVKIAIGSQVISIIITSGRRVELDTTLRGKV